MSQIYDIIIIGAGPAGLTLATLLTGLKYRVKIIDNRPTPTRTGRADGLQPYTLSLLKSMGLKRAIMAHGPARVFQVAFWAPRADGGGIHRTGVAPSCPESVGARYPYTTTLHQGLIERVFIDEMGRGGVSVQRPWIVADFGNEGEGEDHSVRVELKHVESAEREVVRAKYLFDAEGARSFVRERLGIKVVRKEGEKHVWGVMDGVVRTDFPDVKIKCTIHSDHGSIMLIPRENNLVRFYVQLETSIEDFNFRRQATQEEVQATAKKILKPYFIEWDHVEWYSNYPISQGIAEKYTLDHRIFLGGDCCHTHSPKAGQGMNTAFHDALNLAWKIHHVESGFADRRLLHTYESERKAIAETLLAFDAKYAALFSQRNNNPSTTSTAGSSSSPLSSSKEETENSNAFLSLFKSNQLFTSGYGIIYLPSTPLTVLSPPRKDETPLYLSYPPPGAPLPRTIVTRLSDARPIHLEQAVPFNGAFRVLVFVGSTTVTTALEDFSRNIELVGGLFARGFNTEVSSQDVRGSELEFCSFCVIFASPPSPTASSTQTTDLPNTNALTPLLSRRKDRIFTDTVRSPNTHNEAHAKTGFLTTPSSPFHPSSNSEHSPSSNTIPNSTTPAGGIVVLRPDTHVACSIPLLEGSATVDALVGYFRGAGYYVGGLKDGGGSAGKEEDEGGRSRL